MNEATTQFVSAAGLTLRASVSGQGPPLLMINGIGANIEVWQPLAGLLTSRRLIRFDAPGTGLSPVPDQSYRMRALADVVAGLLDRLDLEVVDVLGYSFGGALAQEFARQHPRRLRKLILVGTIPGLGAVQNPRTVIAAFDPRLAGAGSERRRRKVARLVGGRSGSDPSVLDVYERNRLRHPPSVAGYRFQLRALTGWSSITWLHTLSAPTLVLAGGRDPIVPVINSRIFARLIPDCRRHVVSDGGHLFPIDQPEDVAPAIQAFLGTEPDLLSRSAA